MTGEPRLPPRLAELADAIEGRSRLFKDVVTRAASAFGADWVDNFEDALTRLFPTTEALERAAHGYVRFVSDLLRRQKLFEREREYPAKTYAEAAAEVYFDEDYMSAEYLPGLLLSHYLWRHHVEQLAFFEEAFVTPMRRAPEPRFAEVGVGTGIFSRRALQTVPSATGMGFDISPHSVAFAAAHVAAFGLDDRYELRTEDITVTDCAPFDWLISVEVLEHLEAPTDFLRGLRRLVAPGGRAFVTAALNAAHVDHIYLYEDPGEVIAQLRETGFTVEQYFVGLAYKPPGVGVPVPSVAAFVVS